MVMVTDMEAVMAQNNGRYIDKEENRIDLFALFDDMGLALRKFWFRYLLLTLALAALFYGYSRKTFQSTYRSYTTFAISVGSSDPSAVSNQAATKGVVEVMTYVLQSSVLREMVNKDLGRGVNGTVKSSAVEDTNMVTLEVISTSAADAYDMLCSTLRNLPKVSRHILGDITLDMIDSPAKPTTTYNSPDYGRKAVYGAILGIVISLILMVVYALTLRTIRSEDDLKEVLNLTMLGTVPRAVAKKRRKRKSGDILPLMDHSGTPPYFQESIRNIRSRVLRNLPENQPNVILVSSALQGEGKSTLSCNLAISLFRRGYKVILVDGDLRNPSVAKTVGYQKKGLGMLDLLRGEAKLDEVMIPYVRSDSKDKKEHPRFMIIPGSAKRTQQTLQLIHSDRMAALVDEMKKRADFVIIDTPPCAILSDASYYAGYADGAVFVVRQDFASREVIREGVRMLSSGGAKLLGCVMNYSGSGRSGSRYGRYGSYHSYGRYMRYGRYGYYGNRYGHYGNYGAYGYGYGYGNAGENADPEAREEENLRGEELADVQKSR